MSTEFPSLADVIRDHRLITFKDGSPPNCDCGWTSPEQYCTRTDHPEHVEQMWLEARTISTAEQLEALPPESIIKTEGGSIACRFYDREHGVVFGDDRPFKWSCLESELSGIVLWHPDWRRA